MPTPPSKTKDLKPALTRRGLAQYLVVGGLSLAALLAGGGYWLFIAGSDAEAVQNGGSDWEEAAVRDISITVAAEGELVAKEQLDILNLIDHPDDERIETIVEEGTWVNGPTLDPETGEVLEEGDLLYTLNAPGLESDYEEWQSRVREAMAELVEAKRNKEIEEQTAEAAESKAKLAVEIAELALKQWEQGEHKQRLRDLDLAIKKAKREFGLAKRELAYSKELNAKGYTSDSELEQREIDLIEAENALKTAELNIDIYKKFEYEKSKKQYKNDLVQAQGDLLRTKKKNESKLALLQAKIESEQSELKQRELRVNDLKRMVDAMNVYAPRSGMVIYASTIGMGWEKYRIIRPGAGLRGGQRVMVLSNINQMVANIYVHESRINEIEPGQKVSIKVNARPGEVFRAEVIGKKSSAVQEGGGSNPHLRQYLVLAAMPRKLGEDIRPGMNVRAEIAIDTIPEALSVPIQAVHTEASKHFVYVPAEDGKVKRQAVEIGGASDTYVHIKSGIQEGTKVLLRNPKAGELIDGDDALTKPGQDQQADEPKDSEAASNQPGNDAKDGTSKPQIRKQGGNQARTPGTRTQSPERKGRRDRGDRPERDGKRPKSGKKKLK